MPTTARARKPRTAGGGRRPPAAVQPKVGRGGSRGGEDRAPAARARRAPRQPISRVDQAMADKAAGMSATEARKHYGLPVLIQVYTDKQLARAGFKPFQISLAKKARAGSIYRA